MQKTRAKTVPYYNLITGDMHYLLGDNHDANTDPPLKAMRERDLKHALHRIVQAKHQGSQEATFKHQPATILAVHAALRQLGYLPRKKDHKTSVVTWAQLTLQ